jgi:hypothetical protein
MNKMNQEQDYSCTPYNLSFQGMDVTLSKVMPAGSSEMREIFEARGFTVSEEQNFDRRWKE